MTRRILSVVILLCWIGAVAASIAVPELRARVTDLSNTLDAARKSALESRLENFEREHASQVVVLVVPTTQPETIEQYAIRVAEAWKLGRPKQDDGVLLLVSKNDRALRIEVGQGLEGAIPDAVAKRLIEEVILPKFRQDDFAGGIEDGVERILGLIRGESLPAPASSGVATADSLSKAFPLLFGLILLGQVLRRALGRLPGAGLVGVAAFALGLLLTGAMAAAIFFGLLGFLLTLFGLSTGIGHFGGGYGGGGGGGFRGGGGGFSGGGASGRW